MPDYSDQEIRDTITLPGSYSGSSIGTWQADYPFTAQDFEHIKHGRPPTATWASSIFLTSLGIGLNLLGKFISSHHDDAIVIYSGEWIALVIGLVLSLILFAIGCILPNPRKKLLNNIKKHFDNSPRRRQMVRRPQR